MKVETKVDKKVDEKNGRQTITLTTTLLPENDSERSFYDTGKEYARSYAYGAGVEEKISLDRFLEQYDKSVADWVKTNRSDFKAYVSSLGNLDKAQQYMDALKVKLEVELQA